MNTMMNSKLNSTGTDCKTCKTHLADLLLDDGYAAEHPEFAAHLAACSACEQELAELRSTFALLDDWTAPEPSPYFDSKLHVRLREAEAAGPEGFWERTRSFLLFSTGRHFRPALTSALAFAMLIGGGGLSVLLHRTNQPVPTASATVNDLKILDNNAEAMQQMDQLLDESGSGNDDAGAPPTT